MLCFVIERSISIYLGYATLLIDQIVISILKPVVLNLFNMSPPPPYLMLFFTSFTFRIIATQQTFIKN